MASRLLVVAAPAGLQLLAVAALVVPQPLVVAAPQLLGDRRDAAVVLAALRRCPALPLLAVLVLE